jgi:hypothetical protein
MVKTRKFCKLDIYVKCLVRNFLKILICLCHEKAQEN